MICSRNVCPWLSTPCLRMAVAIVFLLNSLGVNLALAQVITNITPDTTLPTNSVMLPNGNVFNITAGTSVGNNLFHSFQEFNVGSGDTANFVDPGGIANILSRVTGTNVSNIFGQLRSDSSANLFFLNPNGVVFGPNSSLDVGGSFHVSTANFLRFEDGNMFYTDASLDESADSLLRAAPTEAFGFLGNPSTFGFTTESPAPITIGPLSSNAPFSVNEGETLSLFGGDITITGDGSFTGVNNPIFFPDGQGSADPELRAPGGRINIASMRSTGEVPIALQEFDVDVVEGLGDIAISNAAQISTNGDTGGSVVIRGGKLQMSGSSIFASTGNVTGPPIAIDIQIDGDILGGEVLADSFGSGKSGDITVTAENLEISGEITTNANSSGNAGNVEINVANLKVTNGPLGSRALTFDGTGNPGEVNVNADSILVTDTGRIESQHTNAGSGTAGIVMINADTVRVDNGGGIFSTADEMGNGGEVNLQVRELVITKGGQISSSTEADNTISPPTGYAGTVIVNASEEVTISGVESGIFSKTAGSGEGGSIQLSVDSLSVTDGAVIDAGATLGSTGDAGSITIEASDTISVSSDGVFESGILSQAKGTSNGGQITITAPRLEVETGGRISAITLADPGVGGGTNGEIVLNIGDLVITGGAIDGLSAGDIVTDGSLGAGVALTGPDFVIGSDLGQVRGNNLFHSFSRFMLQPGESATFTGPLTIARILSRMTGDDTAILDGRIRSTIPGVDLFFLVPNGVFVGPSARLDLGGSFHLNTAHFLRLDDGTRWDSRQTDNSGLSDGTPLAFGFDNATLSEISVIQNRLFVKEGKVLSFIGGEIGISSELRAPLGQIEIISVASPGEVLTDTSAGSPSFRTDGFQDFGKIEIGHAGLDSETSTLVGNDVSIAESTIATKSLEVTGTDVSIVDSTFGVFDAIRIIGTEIALEGGDFNSTDTKIVGIDLPITDRTSSISIRDGHRISADFLELEASNITVDGEFTGIEIGSSPVEGIVAKIIGEETVTFSNGSFLSSGRASGNAGDVLIETPSLLISNAGFTGGTTSGDNKAGGFLFNVGSLEMRSSNIESAGGVQPAGTLIIRGEEGGSTAADSVTLIDSTIDTTRFFGGPFTPTGSGQISIITDLLRMENDSHILNIGAMGGGGGSTELKVGTVELLGGSTIESGTTSSGDAGTITIHGVTGVETQANTVTLSGSNESETPSSILSTSGVPRELTGFLGEEACSQNCGNAGEVMVFTEMLSIEDGGLIGTQTAADGKGGTITINAAQVDLKSGAQIRTDTGGTGDAGSITLNVNDLRSMGTSPLRIPLAGTDPPQTTGVLISSSSTNMSTASGSAGQIRIQGIGGTNSPANSISLTDTTVSTTLTGGGEGTDNTPTAGDVLVEGITVALANGTRLLADAEGEGDAGSITMKVGSLTSTGTGPVRIPVDPDDGTQTTGVLISSSSANMSTASGSAGSITIQGNSPANSISLTDTTVSTTLTGGGEGTDNTPTAGDVLVEGITVALANGTRLLADAEGEGDAGSITMKVTDLTATGTGPLRIAVDPKDTSQTTGVLISSSSTNISTGSGSAGTVTIQGTGGDDSIANSVSLTDTTLRTTLTGGGKALPGWLPPATF